MSRRRTPPPGTVRTFRPAFWDRTDGRHCPPAGTKVRVIRAPHGCPPNGTMGHCYVEHLDGTWIGLVQIASLVKD